MKCNFGKTIQSRKTGREAATTGWLKLYGTPTEMTNDLCAHPPLSPASENRSSTDIRRQMDALQSLGKDCCIKATMFLETHPMFLKKHTFPQTSWILLSSSSAITSPLSIEMFHRCGSIQWVHHLEGGHPAWNHRPVSSWGRIFFPPQRGEKSSAPPTWRRLQRPSGLPTRLLCFPQEVDTSSSTVLWRWTCQSGSLGQHLDPYWSPKGSGGRISPFLQYN